MENNIFKMSICVKLSDFAVQQRLAQYSKLAILQLKKNYIYIYFFFFKEVAKTITTKK